MARRIDDDRQWTVAVVLAAGRGSRFGGIKQIADLGGRPILRWAIDAAAGHRNIDETIVVLGAHAACVRERVDLTGATIVICEDWARGPAASLRVGIDAAIERGASAVVVTLGDHPMLHPDAIGRVLDAPTDVARASYDGRPGHPVVLRGGAMHEVVALDDPARRSYLREHAVPVPVEDVDDGVDVDRPEDLRALARSVRPRRAPEHPFGDGGS